jgi:enoyl-[acyl-carrier protein] reductase II
VTPRDSGGRANQRSRTRKDLLDKQAIEMAEAQLQIEHYWAGALRRAVIDGDVETGSVMAGQSVGMVIREEPVADIIQELVDEAAAALESRG